MRKLAMPLRSLCQRWRAARQRAWSTQNNRSGLKRTRRVHLGLGNEIGVCRGGQSTVTEIVGVFLFCESLVRPNRMRFISRRLHLLSVEAKEPGGRIFHTEAGIPNDLRGDHAVGDPIAAVAKREIGAGQPIGLPDSGKAVIGFAEGAGP